MRKLAPMFITTSILALAAGNVLANDMSSTDKTGSPTVSNNTEKQPLSYSDKSNTAKGTNAKMKDKASTSATGSVTSDSAVKSDSVNTQTQFGTDEDKRDAKLNSNTPDTGDQNAPSTTHKVKKAKVSHHTSKMHKDTVAKDDTVTNTPTEATVKNPPLSATKGEAANSTTGKSAGQ